MYALRTHTANASLTVFVAVLFVYLLNVVDDLCSIFNAAWLYAPAIKNDRSKF